MQSETGESHELSFLRFSPRLAISTRFWGVFWTDVSTRTRAEESFSEVAEVLGCAKTIDAVRKTLANVPLTKRWILILDNADDPNIDYRVYMPSGNRGAILVTSRNPQCGLLATAGAYEELDSLEESECIQLLHKTAGLSDIAHGTKDYAFAVTLVRHLGLHTLAILHAGSYIATTHCSISEYLEYFRGNRRRLLERSRGQGRSRYDTVYATFGASMEFLESQETSSSEETRRDALQLLEILSTFHYRSLPLDFLLDSWESIGEVSKPDEEFEMYSDALTPWHVARLPNFLRTKKNDVEIRISDALTLLESLALVRTDRFGRVWKSVSMHPLVHGWAQDRQTPQERKEVLRTTECLVALSNFAFDEWRPYYYQFTPHLKHLIDSDKELVDDAAQCRKVLQAFTQIAWIYHRMYLNRDLYEFTGRLFQQLNLYDQEPTTELRGLYRLFAMAAGREGSRPAQALRVFQAIARLDEKTLGENDPARLSTMRELGVAYQKNGRTKEAVALLQKVVKGLQGRGAEDGSLLSAQHCLAQALIDDGQNKEAITSLEKVVIIKESFLSEDNPDRLASQQVLATAYLKDGQIAEATLRLEEVAQIEAQTLGEEHPTTATARAWLASAYKQAGRLSEAIALHEQVVKTRALVLGEEHPDLLTSQHNLASAYLDAGRVSEAIALCEGAIDAQATALGRKDPDLIREQHHLAKKCLAAGRVSETFGILEAVLKNGNLMSDRGDDDLNETNEMRDVASSHSSRSERSGPRSVFSEVPTEGDTASSVPSLELSISIAGRVVEVLRKDDQLERLFNETKSRTGKDKFERNFRRLFRVFLRDLKTEVAGSESPTYNVVIHRVRQERGNIASAMAEHLFGVAEHLFGDPASSERFKVPENEPVNKEALVHEFLLTMRFVQYPRFPATPQD